MTDTEPAVVVSNLTLAFGSSIVLADVSLTIPHGSITSIIGPNGSGKTTLLKALLGLVKPRKGEITVLHGPPAQARSRIGYVPQRFHFDRTFPIRVSEFLHFTAPECSHRQLCDTLGDLNVEALEDRLLGELSGGQLQRVMIARAMLTEPEILYLDEPAVGIDLGGEQDFYDIVAHLHEEHQVTVVLVSHEVDLVQNFSDKVIGLNHGTIIVEGKPTEALTPEAMERLFGHRVALFERAGV